MKKFLALLQYIPMVILHVLYYRWHKPGGIVGSLVYFGFIDHEGDTPHGVVAFLVDKNLTDRGLPLYGPFGFRSLFYGRDTWGRVSASQLELPENLPLRKLAEANPGEDILLAGVRAFRGRHPWPLSDPKQFVLAENLVGRLSLYLLAKRLLGLYRTIKIEGYSLSSGALEEALENVPSDKRVVLVFQTFESDISGLIGSIRYRQRVVFPVGMRIEDIQWMAQGHQLQLNFGWRDVLGGHDHNQPPIYHRRWVGIEIY